MVEVDKHGHTKKLYAVAQFNEKPNFTRPNSNYISSLSLSLAYEMGESLARDCDQITIAQIT